MEHQKRSQTMSDEEAMWRLEDWLEEAALCDAEEYKRRWDTRHEFLESLKSVSRGTGDKA
jgi:hypothetical protein